MKKIIIALGGNALIKSGQKGTVKEQLQNLRIPIR
jgi:carbamate kinase